MGVPISQSCLCVPLCPYIETLTHFAIQKHFSWIQQNASQGNHHKMYNKYVRSLFVTNTQNTCYGYALTLEVASNLVPHTRYKNEVMKSYIFMERKPIVCT